MKLTALIWGVAGSVVLADASLELPGWLQSLDALGVAVVMGIAWQRAEKRADAATTKLVEALTKFAQTQQSVKESLERIERYFEKR